MDPSYEHFFVVDDDSAATALACRLRSAGLIVERVERGTVVAVDPEPLDIALSDDRRETIPRLADGLDADYDGGGVYVGPDRPALRSVGDTPRAEEVLAAERHRTRDVVHPRLGPVPIDEGIADMIEAMWALGIEDRELPMISAQFGHASYSITADLYAKVREPALRKASEALDAALGGGVG